MARSDDAAATRPSLLLRIRDPQDAHSWQDFVNLYGPLIHRYARNRRLQEADAADVCQEVLSQVSRSIRGFQYQPERGRFRDWLGTVTRNQVNRYFKRVADPSKTIDADAASHLLAPEQDGEWNDAFYTHVLKAAMDRVQPHFEENTWDTFRRVWLDQQPATDIASRLKMPIAAVYLAKSRVLARLREEVMLLADDFPLESA